MPTCVILLSKDLLFITKVKEQAALAGVPVTIVRSRAALADCRASLGSSGLVFVDLEKGVEPLDSLAPDLIELARSGHRCVCFFSHVHGELQARAEALGFEEVLPRSRFVKVLPDLLRS